MTKGSERIFGFTLLYIVVGITFFIIFAIKNGEKVKIPINAGVNRNEGNLFHYKAVCNNGRCYHLTVTGKTSHKLIHDSYVTEKQKNEIEEQIKRNPSQDVYTYTEKRLYLTKDNMYTRNKLWFLIFTLGLFTDFLLIILIRGTDYSEKRDWYSNESKLEIDDKYPFFHWLYFFNVQNKIIKPFKSFWGYENNGES
jgi:hypothetical protein